MKEADGTIIDLQPVAGAKNIKVILHHDQMRGLYQNPGVGFYRSIKLGQDVSRTPNDRTARAAISVHGDAVAPTTLTPQIHRSHVLPHRLPLKLPSGHTHGPRPAIPPPTWGVRALDSKTQQRMQVLLKRYPKSRKVLLARGIWNLRGLLRWILHKETVAEALSYAHKDMVSYRIVKRKSRSDVYFEIERTIRLENATDPRLLKAENPRKGTRKSLKDAKDKAHVNAGAGDETQSDSTSTTGKGKGNGRGKGKGKARIEAKA